MQAGATYETINPYCAPLYVTTACLPRRFGIRRGGQEVNRVTREEARRLLRLTDGDPDPRQVKDAFRRAAKQIHPDLQRTPADRERSEELLMALMAARDLLLAGPTPAPTVGAVPERKPGGPPRQTRLRALEGLRHEPVVQALGWGLMVWGLLQDIYPWWAILLPLAAAALLALSTRPPGARTPPPPWPVWRRALGEVGGVLAYAVIASALVAGAVAWLT